MAVLTEEQAMLRDQARSWVAQEAPLTALRKLRTARPDAGFDPSVWQTMAEMGWSGILVPEAHGGSAMGMTTLGLVLREAGRNLVASPLVSTAVGGVSALALGGRPNQQAAWLPRIAAGEAVVALAVDEGPHHAPQKLALAAVADGDGFLLNGTKSFVIDGAAADLLILAARTSGQPGDRHGITLFLLEAGAPGLSRLPLRTLDGRNAADLTLSDVHVGPQDVLGDVDDGFGLLDRVLDRMRAGLAAEMQGASEQAFETTVEYLKTRIQFGQPIGAFQALQHRAAAMRLEIELTDSCVQAALTALDDGAENASALVSLAKARSADLAKLVTNEMIQMHGGIGMTDEHDAGLYIKRARAAAASLGGAAFHRERYAGLLGY